MIEQIAQSYTKIWLINNELLSVSKKESPNILTMFLILNAIIIFVRLLEYSVGHILKVLKYTDFYHNEHTNSNSNSNSDTTKNTATKQWNIASIILTTMISFGALFAVKLFNTCEDIETHNTTLTKSVLLLLVAYLSYDLFFHKLSKDFIIHHLFAIIPVTLSILSNNNFCLYFATKVVVIELSTIALGMTYLTSGKTKMFWSFLFAVLFFFVRIIYLPFVGIIAWKCCVFHILSIVNCLFLLPLYILNVYWFFLICKKIKTLLQKEQ